MIRFSFDTSRAGLPVACLLVLAFLYYGWTWSQELGDFGGDNATYLLTARHFSPWSGPDVVAAYFASQSQYPPLYPLVLAVFGGGSSVLTAHVITTTALLLAFVAFYFWLRHLGLSCARAIVVTGLFALLPGTYMHALSILSENLYLLLTLLSFLAVTAHETGHQRYWLWTAAAAIACAALTRSAGLCLIAAFFLYLLLHRPPRYWLLGLATVVPLLVWQVSGQQTAPGYLNSLVERYSSDPLATLLAHLSNEARMIWIGWVGNFSWSRIGVVVTTVVGGACLLGTAFRIWERKLDGFYTALYFLLILLWPYPAEAQRFVLVAVPILLTHGMLLLDRLPPPRVGSFRFHPSMLMLLAVAIVAMPSLLLAGQRFFQAPAQLADLKRTAAWYATSSNEALHDVTGDRQLVEHIKSVRADVGEGECLYSIKPSIVGFYAHRISLIPPRMQWDSAVAEAYLNSTNCRFFYLIGFASPSFPSAYYPLERLQDRLTIVSAADAPGGATQPVGLLATYR